MLKLYSFFWDCNRMGNLEGLFIADDKDVEKIIGLDIYFGDVLGKHSSISGVIEKEDIKIKSEDPALINELIKIFESYTLSGYNPFDYIGKEDYIEEENENY